MIQTREIRMRREEALLAMRTNDGLVDRAWALWRQRAMGQAGGGK